MPEPAALAGVRVVDATAGLAGPLAAMLLADFGADVVRLEPPGVDPGRGDPGFAVWNRGKRALAIDAGSDGGRRATADLLSGADVCVVSGPVSSPSFGLAPPSLAEDHPGLVVLHLPPYADDAPWVGGSESEGLLCAATGVALRQASFGPGPVDSIYPHVLTVQGLWAAAAAVAALVERRRSGRGQVVTVGGVHGVMVAAAGGLTFDPAAPEPSRPPGGASGTVPYYRLYECSDGEWLFLAALTPRFTERAFAALGLEWLMTDERLGQRPRAAMLSPEHSGWVMETIAETFRTRPRDEWLGALADAGCPAGPVMSRRDWLDHPQLAAIGMRIEVDDPERGLVVMPGVPVVLSATPGRVRGPAPARPPVTGSVADTGWPQGAVRAEGGAAGGAHGDDDAVGTLGGAEPPGPGSGQEPDGPLAGVRVLDLGAIIAGPFAASLLAELGADVVKVEPLTGDSFRGPGFAAYNKGQRGMAVDLSRPEGRSLFLRLVERADVVVDNYRPGVLGRLGITYDDLRAVNRDVITVTVTGFGDGGPLGGEAGFDPVLQAMSGIMAAQGGADEPVFFTIPVNDVAAASAAALGACLALYHRAGGGPGQRVATSLAAMSTILQAGQLVRFEGRPDPPEGGRDHRGPADCDRFYPVRDGWVRVQAAGVESDLGPLLAGLGRDEAVNRLNDAGIPAAPARRVRELADDPVLGDWGVLVADPRPSRSHLLTAGRPARFGRTARGGLAAAPELGEHTDQLLAEAGLEAGEIASLRTAGVIR
ncbi:MAG TPA: CoA transferase [Acidimicrobiales bacterium]|nr:CoA transferase [Acidimicrobiales bacterium]